MKQNAQKALKLCTSTAENVFEPKSKFVTIKGAIRGINCFIVVVLILRATVVQIVT